MTERTAELVREVLQLTERMKAAAADTKRLVEGMKAGARATQLERSTDGDK